LAFGAPVLTAAAFAVTPGVMAGAMSDIEAAHITNPLGIDALAGVIDALKPARRIPDPRLGGPRARRGDRPVPPG
jgi:hypothetical protein